ncbi:hypothetical protein [Paenibacillus sp. sptzw28]|uniref:hypothetical protein n=1 Tax=Paenibacillus sp. sptzw28 TaxID=715179 RepID=UPI002162A67F|nr:hypothetical protein [Paenibacillus sp. sptzw28]
MDWLQRMNHAIEYIEVNLENNIEYEQIAESFSRAFQNLHGLTPSSARNAGSQLKAYPRISFQIILKGVVGMNYRIEKRDAFQVFGLEDIYNYDNIANQQGVSIPEVWQNICKNGEFDRLRQVGNWGLVA